MPDDSLMKNATLILVLVFWRSAPRHRHRPQGLLAPWRCPGDCRRASKGRVKHLFLLENGAVPGEAKDVADLLNTAAVQTIRHGGELQVLPAAKMPGGGPICYLPLRSRRLLKMCDGESKRIVTKAHPERKNRTFCSFDGTFGLGLFRLCTPSVFSVRRTRARGGSPG